ncbi:hypothetical protein B0H67DRAFT_686789 [Lasiosphaeris hirsuta]|uniref:Uncharacterized protein n=1 Tax=Lasiosphaeris hirsuta TaxID=260670 RepID=A0AA39ZVE7_9PEZI|nr:hypothetical protein B0H67DRAFT_686789 [Lasiosphaeris hirsuta]
MRTVTWTLRHRHDLSAPEGDDLALSAYGGEERLGGCGDFASGIINLLLVSKAVCNEVRRIVFSENDIGVSQTRFGGLRTLADSGSHNWQDLRVLVIRMQPCGCLTPYCTVEGWPGRDVEEDHDENEARFFRRGGDADPRHHRRLGSVDRHDRDTLYQWERICAGIVAHGRLGSLRLFMACDVEDVDVAKRIVKPLFSLPRLQDIAITFGSPCKDATGLRQLAKETVLGLLGKLHETEPFRFLDLPVELQHKIIGYTALGATSCVHVQLDGTRWFSPPLLGMSCSTPSERGEKGFPYAYETRSLFCGLKGAAFSSACGCSLMPLSWFRVSQRFGHVARAVFYSQTEFKVFGWDDSSQLSPMYPSADADTDRCAPKAFRDFLHSHSHSHDSIRRTRKLTLVFPPMDPTYLAPERKSWTLWLETVQLLATTANLASLELRVCFARHIYPLAPDGNDWERLKMVKDVEEEMRATYRQIVAPMKQLGGLKKLFIHVAWPFRDGLAGVRRADERMLEQTVMGGLYDSRMLHKPLDTFWSQPGFIDRWG